MTTEKTHEQYRLVTEVLGIKNPPDLIVDDLTLESKGLAGLHDPKEHKITLRTWDDEQEHDHRITMIHELTHYVIGKAGYKGGSHGWPFLALCAILSSMIPAFPENKAYNIDFIIYYNAKNWRQTSGMKTWVKHAYRAREIAYKKTEENKSGTKNKNAHEIAEDVINNTNKHRKIDFERLFFFTHRFFAKTSGIEELLVYTSAISFVTFLVCATLKINIGIYFFYMTFILFFGAFLVHETRDARLTIQKWKMSSKDGLHKFIRRINTPTNNRHQQ